MFRFANPHDFKQRVAEVGRVDGMDIVLDVVDELYV